MTAWRCFCVCRGSALRFFWRRRRSRLRTQNWYTIIWISVLGALSHRDISDKRGEAGRVRSLLSLSSHFLLLGHRHPAPEDEPQRRPATHNDRRPRPPCLLTRA